MARDDGLVDPFDDAEVVPVLVLALRQMGPGGLIDLLTRLPGVRTEAPVAKGFLRAARPGSVWVGPENRIVLTDPLVHEQVVGGIVLARDPLPAGELPAVLARLVAAHARREAVADDAAVALSAVREVCGG